MNDHSTHDEESKFGSHLCVMVWFVLERIARIGDTSIWFVASIAGVRFLDVALWFGL